MGAYSQSQACRQDEVCRSIAEETLPTYGLLLIGTEIKLLDLKSETERKEHIESYLKK